MASAGDSSASAKAANYTFNQLNLTQQTLNQTNMNLSMSMTNVNNTLNNTSNSFVEINNHIAKTKSSAEKAAETLQSFSKVSGEVGDSILSMADAAIASYTEMATAQAGLAVSMRTNMGATDENIKSVINYSGELEKLGVVSAKTLVSGSEELAMYVQKGDTLKTLMPAMTDILAKQHGFSASQKDAAEAGAIFGQIMGGNTDALASLGLIVTDAQKEIFKFGSEEERASELAKIVEDNIGGINQALAETDVGKVTNLSNSFETMQAEVGGALIGLKIAFMEIFQSISTFMMEPIMKGVDFIKEHLSELVLVVGAVAAVMAVSWIIANWPLVLIIGTIIFLVGILSEAGVTIDQILGFICGLFAGLGALIWDIFLGLFDRVAIGWNFLINRVIEFVNFFANIFKNPISSVIYLFHGLADNVLMVIEKIAEWIDFVFGSKLASGISNFRAGMKSAADDLVNKVAPDENYKKVVNNVDITSSGLGLKKLNVVDSAKAGYKAGEAAGNSVKDAQNSMLNMGGPKPTPDFNPKINRENIVDKNMLKPDGTKELNLPNSTANALGAPAGSNPVVNNNQSSPVVNVYIDHISKDVDIDTVVEKIVDGLEEASSSRMGRRRYA